MNLYVWTVLALLGALGHLAAAERVYLLDTLNATSELGWSVYSSLDTDGWLEETYRSDTRNFNHQAFSTCVVEHSNFENWLLLPRIERRESHRLYFEIKFTMRKCHDIPSQTGSKAICKETLKLYAHPVGHATLLPSHNWHNSTDWRLVETLAPNADDSQVFVQTASFALEHSSVYFAIKDTGSCSSVLYVKVYYDVCDGGAQSLTHFARTLPGVDLHSVITVTGECSANSSLPSGRMERPKSLCKADGSWQMLTEKCQCNPGFIYSRSANTCAPCGLNSFKKTHGEGECLPCPANSHADSTGSVFCNCLAGFYRPTGAKRDAACVPQPAATPEDQVIIQEHADNVEILIPNQQSDQLRFSKNSFFLVCAAFSALTIIVLGLVFICYHKSVQDKKQHSDLDALDTYKQGTMTPDYGHSNKGAFSAGTFKRKLNVPLIPAYGSPPMGGITNRYKPYVDPTTYEDPKEALAEFTNEIPPENVEVTRTIGAGEFGEVCSGRLKVENLYGGVVQQIVAVKTLLPGSAEKAKADFLAEASIMGQFEHENVIRLVGVVTKSEPVMILTEYMLNGSLDKFLRDNDNGRLMPLQLVQMMHGIACGMKYLTDKGYVHRDLAARNVLVDDRLTCKIADFGLSRGVDDSEQEYTTQGGKIPIRWTAPEAISHHKYTAASDVWSFGVVMWEIASFGERPYWDWTNHKVIQEVEAGFRLPRPMDSPMFLHDIMLECWQQDRHKRPTFDHLVQRLAALFRHTEKDVMDSSCYNHILDPSSATLGRYTMRPMPPSSAPPLLSVADFLRLNNLSHYLDLLRMQGIVSLERLAESTYEELTRLGVGELDAQRIVQSLACHSRSAYNAAAPTCPRLIKCPSLGPTQGLLPPALGFQQSRSPLLSGSSIGTNNTTLSSVHGSISNVNVLPPPPPSNLLSMPRLQPSPRHEGFFV